MTATPYRILVTGSSDRVDEQELRLDLIHATFPRLPDVTVVLGACPPALEAMAARWAADYEVRAEAADGEAVSACLTFGGT